MINFQVEKEPKMKIVDLRALQKFMLMLSLDKIIFHIVLGEFHITSRNKRILHDIRQNNGRKSKSIFTNYLLPI